jgi:DEAD/DEAH box helicase domain-containing protein
MVPDPRKPESSAQRAQLEQFWNDLPGSLPYEQPPKPVACGNLNDPMLTFRYWITQALADPESAAPKSPGFLVLDPAVAESEPDQHRSWRRWLWMFNTLQHLPGVFLATRDGLLGADHNAIAPAEAAKPASGGGQAAEAAGWAQAMDQAMEFLLPGLKELQGAGAPVPDEVGYELESDGEVVAECELVWTSRKVVLLLDHHADSEAVWTSRGWTTVKASPGWPALLLNKLNESTPSGAI